MICHTHRIHSFGIATLWWPHCDSHPRVACGRGARTQLFWENAWDRSQRGGKKGWKDMWRGGSLVSIIYAYFVRYLCMVSDGSLVLQLIETMRPQVSLHRNNLRSCQWRPTLRAIESISTCQVARNRISKSFFSARVGQDRRQSLLLDDQRRITSQM